MGDMNQSAIRALELIKSTLVMLFILRQPNHQESCIEQNALLIGGQVAERLTADELVNQAGTIPFEILPHLNERLPWVYGAAGVK